MCVENKGIIFDISRYCLNDGPGIRTTVFLKGCAMRCKWCHNPESQRMTPELLYSEDSCISCGYCVGVCLKNCHSLNDTHRLDRTNCTACGECASVCLQGACRIAGREITADQVIKEVLKDRNFYGTSGGGMTVSGGEPMLQPDFLESLLTLARDEGIHTAVETCGYAEKNSFLRIAPLVDCFLFDYKESDPEKHRLFTGRDQGLILENLELLDSLGANIILRIPLIPGYNATPEHAEGICKTAGKFPSIGKIEILPYHPLGVSKEKELGRSEVQNIAVPEKELIDEFISAVRNGVSIPVEVCV